MVTVRALEPTSSSCLNGYRTRVSVCRCRKHWKGEFCDIMDCGPGRLNSDNVTCECPPDFVGKHCYFQICRLPRSNITYCYPSDNGATPLYSRCTVENRSFSSSNVVDNSNNESNLSRLKYCSCFRGTKMPNGLCRCVDDFWGNLCELRPGNVPEHLYFDSDGEMWKNNSVVHVFTPRIVSSAPWASPFTLFTIFILLTVLLIACFRQRHTRWRIDSLRMQALHATLFRHAINGDNPAHQHRYNSRRFRMIFDGGAPIRRPDSVVNPQLEPMLTSLPVGRVTREHFGTCNDTPPSYEEVVNSPPPYKPPPYTSS